MENDDRLYKVPLTKIRDISPHSGADRLEFATVYGFRVITGKDSYKKDDLCVYVPIDSILENKLLEEMLFPAGSKIKLHDHRVRQIKIRGLVSQGMLIKPQDLECMLGKNWWTNIDIETDLSKMLEIRKYEPPCKQGIPGQLTPRNKPYENSRFHKYGGLTNLKWLPDWFTEGEEIVIQEKLHGSNCRCSIQPMPANTLWRKILRFVKLLPEWQWCYGSNNVQLQDKKQKNQYYGSDVYGAALARVNAKDKLKPGETCFFELIGEGIQKNYHYGRKEHSVVLFDVKVTDFEGNQKYLNPIQVVDYAIERGFEIVPILYKGPFQKELSEKYNTSVSMYYPEHKVREGCVIKAASNYDNDGQKKALKCINPDYLADTSNSDDN